MSLKKLISIALATDSNYYAPTLVAVKSIVINTSDSNNYAIYILSEQPLSRFEKWLILSATCKKKNISCIFIHVGQQIGTLKLSNNGSTKGITQATYFRFLLPNLLKHTDKILYMDADAIALDDIAKIFSFTMENTYVGGVRDIVGYLDKENRCEELNIDSLDQYVNAGVLLMNLDEMRKNQLSEKMLAMAKKRSFSYNDQDIINSVCYGKIKCLPCKCNVIVDYLKEPAQISSVLQLDYTKETKNPFIMHYAGRSKPWYSKKDQYSHLWWQVVDSFNCYVALFIKYRIRKLKALH